MLRIALRRGAVALALVGSASLTPLTASAVSAASAPPPVEWTCNRANPDFNCYSAIDGWCYGHCSDQDPRCADPET